MHEARSDLAREERPLLVEGEKETSLRDTVLETDGS